MRPILSLPVLAAVLISGNSSLQAAVTWNFTFADAGTGLGFDDATLGASRKAVLTNVTGYLNTVLSATGTVDIEVHASQNDPGANTLASAGPYAFTNPGFSNGLVFNHATTGIDLTGPAQGDAVLTVNFAPSYYLGSGAPAAAEFDLYSILLHEISHTMGLLTSIPETPSGSPGAYKVFDSFLSLGTSSAPGDRLVDTSFTFQKTPADLTSDNVFFQGANAVAVNGGPVKIYAPAAFAPGSSIGHPDFSNSTSVMVPGIAPGTMKRTYAPLDRAMLQDIGWTLLPVNVPEPGTGVLALAGVTLLVRRRRAA